MKISVLKSLEEKICLDSFIPQFYISLLGWNSLNQYINIREVKNNLT